MITPETNLEEILQPLFNRARAIDEFEFACTLLRIRGARDAGWDALIESDSLSQQLLGLINAPIERTLQLRLLLLLYCHLTEMDDFYLIVANLLRITLGDRYSMAPFPGTKRRSGRALSPASKVRVVKELSTSAGQPLVGELLDYILIKQVRNAFYHSDYALTDDTFNIVEGEGIKREGIISPRIELEWLIPRLNFGVNTVLMTLGLTFGHIRSYQEDKVVLGRFAPNGGYRTCNSRREGPTDW